MYAKPLVVEVNMQLVVDDELIEYICRENEKDYLHIVGKVSDEKIFVAAEVLSQYVGTYEVHSPQGPNAAVNVTLADGELILDRTPWITGEDRQVLIPLSDGGFIGALITSAMFFRRHPRLPFWRAADLCGPRNTIVRVGVAPVLQMALLLPSS
jgi:hypothetical protein